METFVNDKNEVIPYCICVKFQKTYLNFYGQNLILEFFEKISLISRKKKIVLYTHNINYDGLIFMNYIKDKKIYFDFFVRDSNLYWLSIKHADTEIFIRCSYKIIPLSVKEIGKMINFEKKIFPHKFAKITTLHYIGKVPSEENFESREDYFSFKQDNACFDFKKSAIDYCFRDVEIIEKILKQIIRIISIQDKTVINCSFSFSSIAYKIYIKKFDKFRITGTKNDKFRHEYIKDAYYGGRCEVFGNPGKEKKKIHYYDFSGMYAQCMLEKFPVGESIFKTKNLNPYEPGFHSVRVKCDDYLPFLPYRNEKLMFPNGEFEGRYWYEELINAVSHGKCKILKMYSSLVYKQEDYVFKDYVSYFTNMRKNGIYYDVFGKNMNNGLYGSFALNETNEENIVCYSEKEVEFFQKKTDVSKVVKFGVFYIITIIRNEKSKKILDKNNKWDLFKKRNIAYAAIITAKARIKLNNALNSVILDGGELYYTDTDSIFAGYEESKLNQKIGDICWSAIYEDGVFVSNKFYYLDKLVLKGIRDSSVNLEEIKSKFYSNKRSIIFENQLNIEKNKFNLTQKYFNKEIFVSTYNKRIFNPDKTKTKPHWISPDY